MKNPLAIAPPHLCGVALDIQNPKKIAVTDIDSLTASVNPIRLKNNPVEFDSAALKKLYKNMLGIL